ncbi:probable inactive shikimate kinase like 1, chloroplastic isoform X1 [Coffea arabica]|uniref:Probable inactive shikimate kinase like 1, chloroplastic isoform X1 n=1 Tax=Coffea arabica TaxID=13443 RepID=A0ABM4V8M5_COFAR
MTMKNMMTEITQAGGSWGTTNYLVRPRAQPPALESHSPFGFGFGYDGGLSSPFTTTTTYQFNNRNCRLQRPSALPTSILSSVAKEPLTLSRALLDDTTSSSDAEELKSVAEADPSLTLKKRAAEISPDLKGTSVFLVGINCSIKSNLGKLLAEALRYYYFDSDDLIEAAAGGKSAARLVFQRDEKGFRESETEVLKQLSSMGRLVVSAGNGTVQCAANLAHLRHGISIWIDVPLDMVAREVMENDIQLPASDLTVSGSYSEILTQLTELYERSRSGYTAADSTVSLPKVASNFGYKDLVEVTVEDMALEVLKELQKLMRLKKMMEAAARPF